MTKNILILPGDGIGQEVTSSMREVLHYLIDEQGLDLNICERDVGGSSYDQFGVPLTEETHYLVDNAYINKFKKQIYIINTSRGKCVKTIDLVKNLNNGKVIGACLDVLENENVSFEQLKTQKSFSNLIKNKNIILSPHIAGWSKESNIKIAKILLNKILSSN